MKLNALNILLESDGMPPTRGHDLKRGTRPTPPAYSRMPPTRGHDLKP